MAFVEPTFRDGQHAPINASLIEALASTGLFPRMRFFATATQKQAVLEILPAHCRTLLDMVQIKVGAAGGVRFKRGLSQLGILWASQRGASLLLVLSSGPETFFVCRLLCLLRPRLRILIVLHGNLETATGWRSRNPLRRSFDYRAGLSAANHPNIRFIVLESVIRNSMRRQAVPGWQQTFVLPHPILESEFRERDGPKANALLSIGFIGHAKRSKGFSEFLEMANWSTECGYGYRFVLAGFLAEAFSAEHLEAVEIPPGALSREDFLTAVSSIDFACIPFNPKVYEFTASGSLLDAVCALKPVIAIAFPALLELEAEFGQLGFVCANLDDMRALLADPARLLDKDIYTGFQDNLRRLRASRTPAAQSLQMAKIVGWA